MKKKTALAAAVCVLTAAGLLTKSAAVSQGVQTGIRCCLETLIPSLFPFMILACLIGATDAGNALVSSFSLLLRPLTGMPRTLCAVLPMSWIGGFPVGAKMLSQMLEQKRIDSSTAQKALGCCVNAGPCFLITAVGAGMLGSMAAGAVLLAAQILSSLVICAMSFRFNAPGKNRHDAGKKGLHPRKQDYDIALSGGVCDGAAFVSAVRDASAAMLSVCAFVTAFCAISALLEAWGVISFASGLLHTMLPARSAAFFSAACTGLLEVTSGCVAASRFGADGFLLCAFLVSFSSVSIIFQALSFFERDSGVKFSPFIISRLWHGLLTTLFASLGLRLLAPDALAVSSSISSPVASIRPNMLPTCLCMIAMLTLVASIPESSKKARRIRTR